MTPSLHDELHGVAARERRERIVEVLTHAFGDLAAGDPASFQVKFRKMAASPFAFYRGSATVFYDDVAQMDDPFLDARTSRVWIQGDLHAENFGTYMNAEGRIVFDVNDFDEAYVGPFTWDLRRLVASLALLGYQKALSDDDIWRMVETCTRSYVDQIAVFASEGHASFALSAGNTSGPLHDVISAARARTRTATLAASTAIEDYERRFLLHDNARALDSEERDEVLDAYGRYVETLPPGAPARRSSRRVKDVVARRGVGIGSAGLPSYNLLVEGHTEALEHDVILFMKQGQVAAPARFVDDPQVRDFFLHEGHRTAVSQRALQAHSDPWLGHTTLRGVGQLVAEVSPYTNDLSWDDVNSLDDILGVLRYLGQATAKIHSVAGADSEHGLVPHSTEAAIHGVLAGREDEVVDAMCTFADAYGCRARDDHRLFVDAFRNHQLDLGAAAAR